MFWNQHANKTQLGCQEGLRKSPQSLTFTLKIHYRDSSYVSYGS